MEQAVPAGKGAWRQCSVMGMQKIRRDCERWIAGVALQIITARVRS